jgi:2-keto-4-pentenoate hydratase
MRQDHITKAAERLHRHWQDGTVLDTLPPGERPETRAEGYAIQAGLARFSAHPLYGWKIAATSIAGQKHIGVDGPLAGRIFRERVFPSGAAVPFGANRMAVAEIEFAFRFGRDLAPAALPRSVDVVLDAVATLHPSIEVPDSRFADFVTAGGPQLIADNACAHLFVEGPAYAGDWRAINYVDFRPRGIVAGRYEREGLGANVLGDPRLALTWLANELSGLGITLRAGEIVTTGTCLVPLEIRRGDHVTGDFGALGTVTVNFV